MGEDVHSKTQRFLDHIGRFLLAVSRGKLCVDDPGSQRSQGTDSHCTAIRKLDKEVCEVSEKLRCFRPEVLTASCQANITSRHAGNLVSPAYSHYDSRLDVGPDVTSAWWPASLTAEEENHCEWPEEDEPLRWERSRFRAIAVQACKGPEASGEES